MEGLKFVATSAFCGQREYVLFAPLSVVHVKFVEDSGLLFFWLVQLAVS